MVFEHKVRVLYFFRLKHTCNRDTVKPCSFGGSYAQRCIFNYNALVFVRSSFSRALRYGSGSGFPRSRSPPAMTTSKQLEKNLSTIFSTTLRFDPETIASLKCFFNSLRQSRMPSKGFIRSNSRALRFCSGSCSKCQGSGSFSAFSKIDLISLLSFEPSSS